MRIAIMQFIHIETYLYYFNRNTEECRNGKTKKKDIYYVTIHWKRK